MGNRRFLLCSAATTAAAAAGLAAGRALFLEAGEVLLLFADGPVRDPARRRGDCIATATTSDVASDDDPVFAPHFPGARAAADGGGDEYEPPVRVAGEALLSIGESPFLRASPLVLLLASSAALVVVAMTTREEARRCRDLMRAWRDRGEEASRRLVSAMGASDFGELAEKSSERMSRWKGALDGLVLDDLVRECVATGVEFATGAWGAIILYSLPGEIFYDGPKGAKEARRRLIRAADPSLERMLFRPGGAWDALPPSVREFLTEGSRSPNAIKVDAESDGSVSSPEITWVGSGSIERPAEEDETSGNDEECSENTPLASPLPVVSTRILNRNDVPIHCGRVIRAEGGEKAAGQSDAGEFPEETVADALSATVKDLVVSNFMCTKKRPPKDHNEKSKRQHEEELRGVLLRERTPPSLPQLQLERVLRRAATASTFLFLLHLRVSPSARRSWASAARFSASLCLVSTAVGAGVASAALRTNAFGAAASHPVAGALCAKFVDALPISQTGELSMDVGDGIRRLVDRLMKEVRGNKRLRTCLALAVLGGVGSLSQRGRARCRGEVRRT